MKTFEEYKFRDTLKKEFWIGKKPIENPDIDDVEDELDPITLLEITNNRFGGLAVGGLGTNLTGFVQYLHGEYVGKKIRINNGDPFIVYNIVMTLEYDGNNNNVNMLFYKRHGSYINVDFQSSIRKIIKRKLTIEDPFGEEDWND